jgi:hypothetical protein
MLLIYSILRGIGTNHKLWGLIRIDHRFEASYPQNPPQSSRCP